MRALPSYIRAPRARLSPDERHHPCRAELETVRREAAEVRAALERLERAARGSSDGFWEWNAKTDEVWISPQYALLLGVPLARATDYRMTPEQFEERVHPDGRDEVRAALTRMLEDDIPYDVDARLRLEDGSYRWFRFRGFPEKAEDGALWHLSGSISLIERERAHRAAMAQKQAELQQIIDAFPGFVYYKDDANTILDLNSAAAESIGLPREQIRGRPTEDFFPEEDARAYLEDDQAVIRSGKPRLGIYERYEAAEGDARLIRTDKTPIANAEGKIDRLVALAMDMTEVDRTNARLRETEERLNLSIQAGNLGLWDLEIETRAARFNDIWFTMLGYGPGEFPQTFATWEELVHPEDRPKARLAFDMHIEAAAKRGDSPPFSTELRMRRKDGSYAWIKSSGTVSSRDRRGIPTRMVGVHVDVQVFRDAQARAEAAARAKTELLANMSHELRTPMTAILGFTEVLADDGLFTRDPPRAREAVEIIRSNGAHLLTLINDILDAAKLDGGHLSIEAVSLAPARLIEETLRELEPAARAKGLELEVDVSSCPASISSDPARIRQILLNLVGNALKFTHAGGVTVRVVHVPSSKLLKIDVEDTGIGMSPEQAAKISSFEPFHQADGSSARQFGGTGLGLYISSALTRLLGGQLEVRSEIGVGTTFTASFSTGDGAPELPKPPPLPPGPTTLEGLRVLVAEDNPVNQRLIRHILERAGAQVTMCENGMIAIEALEAQSNSEGFDLIVMDMQMPVLDGPSTVRRLRSAGVKLPILALTANARDEDREQCRAAGYDAFLTKPIDRALLLRQCRSWADRARG